MIFDACVAIFGKPARIWYSGKSLVINALIIQILSYLRVKSIKLSVMPCSELIQDIQQNRFVGGAGRVVTCVLIGYLLPGMARTGSATDWRTLVALVLSLFTYELYYITTLLTSNEVGCFSHNGTKQIVPLIFKLRLLRYGGSILISATMLLMVLLSICAILAGRTIRGILAQKISVIQWDKSNKNEADCQQNKSNKSEEISWEKFEGEIVESWFLARVCHPQYVIARSVLSSAVGLLATMCILLLGIQEFLFHPDIQQFHILLMSWTLEWTFILIGGTVIFCRWFTVVGYFPRFSVKNMKLRGCTRPFVEDFWTRSILELVQSYNLQKWRL